MNNMNMHSPDRDPIEDMQPWEATEGRLHPDDPLRANDIFRQLETEAVDERRAQTRRKFFGHLACGVAAVAVGWGAREIIRDQYNWMHRRAWRKGSTEDVMVHGTERNYPYSRSTLEVFAEHNREMFEDNAEQLHNIDIVMTIADNIANNVARRCLEERRIFYRDAGEPETAANITVEETLADLAETKDGQIRYMRAVAQELTAAQSFYESKNALNQTVTDAFGEDAFKLDCDLLSHVTLHCAARHNMPFIAYNAPLHMYVGSTTIDDLAFEMTLFRTADTAPGFITSHTEKRMRHFACSSSATSGDAKEYGFFEPMDQNMIDASACLGVICAKSDEAYARGDEQTFARLATLAAQKANIYPGPIAPMLRSTAYELHDFLAQCFEKQNKPILARNQRTDALRFRKEYEAYTACIARMTGRPLKPIRLPMVEQ